LEGGGSGKSPFTTERNRAEVARQYKGTSEPNGEIGFFWRNNESQTQPKTPSALYIVPKCYTKQDTCLQLQGN